MDQHSNNADRLGDDLACVVEVPSKFLEMLGLPVGRTVRFDLSMNGRESFIRVRAEWFLSEAETGRITDELASGHYRLVPCTPRDALDASAMTQQQVADRMGALANDAMRASRALHQDLSELASDERTELQERCGQLGHVFKVDAYGFPLDNFKCCAICGLKEPAPAEPDVGAAGPVAGGGRQRLVEILDKWDRDGLPPSRTEL